jgi:hypothetical protein
MKMMAQSMPLVGWIGPCTHKNLMDEDNICASRKDIEREMTTI